MKKVYTLRKYVVECQYFPNSCYISTLIKEPYILLEACEAFQKTSFRNRTMVPGANGVVSLTVPVKNGREQKTLITQVEADNSQDWRTQHWRTISSCYSKAPFFGYYAEGVHGLIFSDEQLLFQLNYSILKWIFQVLKVQPEISLTAEYKRDYSHTNVVDLRNQWLPKNIHARSPEGYVKYPQVFEDRIGFQPNLSFLDLLFNEGPNAAHLLSSNF